MAENVYSNVVAVYSGAASDAYPRSPTAYFHAVRGGGLYNDLGDADFPKFYALCELVSNNCDEIAADWTTYETNDMVRFTTLCAVAYSGLDNYTNFADKVLSRYEADRSCCSWDTVKFIHSPDGTRAERFISTLHEDPFAGDFIKRVRSLAAENGDAKTVLLCDEQLSGEAKRNWQELMSMGYVEP